MAAAAARVQAAQAVAAVRRDRREAGQTRAAALLARPAAEVERATEGRLAQP